MARAARLEASTRARQTSEAHPQSQDRCAAREAGALARRSQQECRQVPRQKCQQVYKTVTTYENKKECKTVYVNKQQCQTTYTDECSDQGYGDYGGINPRGKPRHKRDNYFEKTVKCRKVPHQNCQYVNVPESQCHFVKVPRRSQVPDTKCHNVKVPNCHKVPQKKCHTTSYQPRRRYGHHHNSHHGGHNNIYRG